MVKKAFLAASLTLFLLAPGPAAPEAPRQSVSAKQWPVGYFYQYKKISIPEKERVLGRIDATLKKLNREKCGLIVKGAVLERPDTAQRVYPTLTVLDESGLIIIVRNVPNIYYGYAGPAAEMNRNIFLVAKGARLNRLESYIRYGFVVEADYQAYADKYIKAILRLDDTPAGGAPE